MRFSFSDDQRLFADGLRSMLERECTAAHVRSAWDDDSGHLPALWGRLAEMGVLGMLLPEADGGMDASMIDAVLLLQELGRAATPGPVIETMAVAAPALASTAWAPALADGTLIATANVDESPYVAHAHVADLVLTPTGVTVIHADGLDGVELRDLEGIDGGRRLFEVVGGVQETFDHDVDAAFDRGALAAAAYLIGLSERMIEVTAEYARQRVQFGKPIGSFQAVKHLMADALLKVEFAKAPTYRAAWSISTGQPSAPRDVSLAKAFASEAAYRTSRSTMQVHGGIGYTWEADLQLWMKKAWALMRAYGDATWHRRRVGDAVLTPG